MKTNKKVTRIILFILIFGIGILIGWWINEMWRFAEGMKNDKAPNFDTINKVFYIDSLKQE